MKIVFVIALLLVTSSALYTSKHFQKKGFDLKSTNFAEITVQDIQTVCNDVTLNQSPYNYNGTVKTGYLNVGTAKGSSALAFMFYGKENVAQADLKKYPLLIWLNGGPGSSSQLGNFMQLGPFWITQSETQIYKIVRNQFAWTNQYNILFVDQPVGTGLSYADTRVGDPFVHSMDEVAADFYTALDNMYNSASGCFKSLGITGDSNLFIFGESYAGKYVPAIALKIQQEKQKGGFLKGLKGIAIGDGFTDPYHIMAEVGAFAYNIGLIDFQQRAKIEGLLINGTFQNRAHQYGQLHNTFEKVLDHIVDWSGGVNVYDFTKYHDYPTELLQQYLWNQKTKDLYKLSSEISYGKQATDVYKALFDDFMKSEVHRVELLLSKDLPILIYNGQNDIIVQTPGTMRWVDNMFFKDTHEFREALFTTWKVNGKVAGSYKKAGKLELRIVNNAGHLVPMDQGYNALEMVKQFVNAHK